MRTRSTVVERYRKRDRDFVVNEVDYCDESGRLLVRSRTHQSFLAEQREDADGRAYVVDRDSAAKKERRAVGEGDGPELAPVELEVDLTTCWRFSGPDPQLPHRPRGGEEARLPRRGRAGNALDLPDVAS